MAIRHFLLAGASLGTIGAGAAYGKPPVLLAQLHSSRINVKTAMLHHAATREDYTVSISTSISTSADYRKKTRLALTYYTFFNSGSFCPQPDEKMQLPRHKTKYAKVTTGTESYSEGCGTPTTFYGEVYDLQTKHAAGARDQFSSILIGKNIHYDGMVYRKITANFEDFVAIKP